MKSKQGGYWDIDLRPLVWLVWIGIILLVVNGAQLLYWLVKHVTIGWVP